MAKANTGSQPGRSGQTSPIAKTRHRPRGAARTPARRCTAGAGGAAFDAEREAVRREQNDQLNRALERLSPDYREVLTLRHLQGKPFDEIAARMGRSAGAVRMLWMRALEQLGGIMGNGDETA